jgi:hypothetical protein
MSAKAKGSRDEPAIQLRMSFTERLTAREDSPEAFEATDDDLPEFFFEEVKASKEVKAPAGGSKNLDAAEAVTG